MSETCKNYCKASGVYSNGVGGANNYLNNYLNNSPAVGRGASPPVATGNLDKSGKLAK